MGTTEEILEIFLSNYRATSNPNSSNGYSPVEALMNRKVRLHIDVIHPTLKHCLKRNTVMEKQFNQHSSSETHICTRTIIFLLKITAMAKKNGFKNAFYIVLGMSHMM